MHHANTTPHTRRWRLAGTAALTTLLALGSTGAALAQAYPDKPIKVIVGFPPGGAADQIARLVSTPLATALGQPVVVENRAGANGNIAGDAVAKSPADGYTLVLGSGGMVSVNPHLSRMTFDPVKDIIPVASAARVLVYLMARPTLEVKNVQELVAIAKANPGRMTYGSAGSGSSPHLAGEMLKAQAGVFITHIPYRGSGPAQADFLGNQVPLMVDSVTAALANIQAGLAVPLAVTSDTRSSQLPDVPTVQESGVPGLKDFVAVGWLGLMAPHGIPADILARLNREVVDILRSDAMVKFMRDRGSEAAPTTGPEFDRFIASEIIKWGAAVKASGATAD